MFLYNKNRLDEFNSISFHDAELKEIFMNYYERQIKIPLVCSNEINKERTLVFQNVLYSDIYMCEPWGSGFYVHEIKACMYENNNNEDIPGVHSAFVTTILLNSGDAIRIISEKVIYYTD